VSDEHFEKANPSMDERRDSDSHTTIDSTVQCEKPLRQRILIEARMQIERDVRTLRNGLGGSFINETHMELPSQQIRLRGK
jgi:hypothetical protein